MSLIRKMGVLVAFATGVVFTAQVTIAGESGTYESISSFVSDYTKFEFANQGIISGPLHGTDTITKSSGGPFVIGESRVMLCAVYGKKSDAGMDLEAPCALTDASGDKEFNLSKRSAGDTEVGGGGDGLLQIVGGTGKYAGITGSCSYTIDYLADNRGVSITTCEWQKP